MRCPKCGYNSFDHNLLCPKCRKDLTATRRLLNLTVPIPGATDFFNTAGQRAAFPEPLLGQELSPGDQSGSMFPAARALAAGAAAAASPFGAPPPPVDLPFGAPPFAADATIDDIVPLAADEGLMEDIVPLAADDDLEDIVPIETEADMDEIVPIEVGDLEGEISPVNVAAESTQIMAEPTFGEEEIEIEIDDLVEPIEVAPVPAPPEGHQMAMDHIKSTLAETGDLGAPVEVIPEPEALIPELEISAAPAESLVPVDIEELDLNDEPLIEDIDDSDILESDDIEANIQASDTVSVDLDPEDLSPDFFDEVTPEPAAAPEPEPVPEISLQLDEVPDLEELASGDLAGPFWDEAAPALESPSPAAEMEVPSLEELDEAQAPTQADLSFDSLDDPAIEPEDLAIGLEINLSGFDQELTAEEMFAEEIQPQAAQEIFPEPAAAAAAEAAEKPVHPPAMPEIPAGVFGSIAPEDTLSTPKMTPGGSLDADDLSSLADDINLDDLDSEL